MFINIHMYIKYAYIYEDIESVYVYTYIFITYTTFHLSKEKFLRYIYVLNLCPIIF